MANEANPQKIEENKIDNLLREATAALKDCGIEQSRAEAELLLAYVLAKPRWKLYLAKDEFLNGAEKKKFQELLSLRLKKCPLSYITGRKEFYGREFKVSPAVLIPRPETEILIEAVLETIAENGLAREAALNIADLGTGSGVIAVTLALLLPEAKIFALDISPDALALAGENARNLGVDKRITFARGTFSDFPSLFNVSFNILVANPPYICHGNIDKLATDVKMYEPIEALSGGHDGLNAYREIVGAIPAARFLEPAALIMESGEDSLEGLKGLCRDTPYLSPPNFKKDYRGFDRVLKVKIKAKPR